MNSSVLTSSVALCLALAITACGGDGGVDDGGGDNGAGGSNNDGVFVALPCPSGDKCTAAAITADGTTVFGSRQSGNFLWRWRRGDAALTTVLSADFNGGLARASELEAVSADGSVLVGTEIFGIPNAFRWRAGEGTLMQGGVGFSGISGDGLVVVGYGRDEPTGAGRAFSWTQAGGFVGLGTLHPDNNNLFAGSRALGISGNGQVIVGWSSSLSASLPGAEAFRWTQAGGMVELGDLSGGTFSSLANLASSDGSVIAGWGTSANGQEVFRWTQASGMVGLGDLPGGLFRSNPRGISADGSVIVGEGNTAAGDEAFIWTQASGMRRLADVLTAAGANLTGWTLTSAAAISANGDVVAGYGQSPSSQTIVFIALIL